MSDFWKNNPNLVLLLDNGAYMLKTSLASDSLPFQHFNGMVVDKFSK
jgi:hypothetical protein